MPTGYTGDIYDGKMVSFEDFAMKCARAFGYLIEMRDESLDAPIRDRVPSNYHEQRLESAREMLKELESLSLDDATRESQKEYEHAMKEYDKTTQVYKKLHERYSKMLEKVMAWEPPTRSHESVKEFMISQLKDGINWDCDLESHEKYKPKLIDGAEWKHRQINIHKDDIKYHWEQFEKEKESCKITNEWVSQLRESLKNAIYTEPVKKK